MIDAERAGWTWLVGLWNHIALGVVVLGLAGVAVSGVVLPRIWWVTVLYLSILAVLLFGEGAFELWRRAVDAAAEAPPTSMLAVRLGQFQEQGLALQRTPRIPESQKAELRQFEAKIAAWRDEVAEYLDSEAPQWKAVFLTPTERVRYSGMGEFSRLAEYLDERLQRLAQIIAQVSR